MRFKVTTLALVAGLIVALSGSGFAAKKSGSGHVAVGTITSIDNNQVVINEKVQGKEQPMTFKLDSSTKKSGNLTNGTAVRIHYRTENNQNVATAINERGAKSAKTNTKTSKSLRKS
jgi:hypothetical protein